MSYPFFLGIDPGVSGAFAVLNYLGEVACVGLWEDRDSFYKFENLKDIKSCALEKVGAMPGQGVCSMFTFGQNFGHWLGTLEILKIPYGLVTPQRWQKEVLDFIPTKEAKKLEETKKEYQSRLARNKNVRKGEIVAFVLRRYPDLYHLLKVKKNWGIADAICLALYARSKVDRWE